MSQNTTKLPRLNVVVAGRLGAGKSTLINKILNEKVAQTGIGRPITRKIEPYTSKNNLITLIDTPSLELEMNGQVKFQKQLLRAIMQREKTRNRNQKIHCIWYCINSESKRIEEIDIKFLQKFNLIPIIIVLTRAYDHSIVCQMLKLINSLEIKFNCVVPVLSEDEVLSDYSPPLKISFFGISELLNFTAKILFDTKDTSIFKKFLNTILPLYKPEINENYKVNVVVAGKTGVGKSTLINSILGSNAKVGQGSPITQKIELFGNKNSIFNLYDTPGFETNPIQQNQVKENIIKLLKDQLKTKDINKFIHCIWYCIQSVSSRIEDQEKDFIREFANKCKIPIIVVITKCYYENESKILYDSIKLDELKIINKIPIVAEERIDDDFEPVVTHKQFGIKKLLNITAKTRPE